MTFGEELAMSPAHYPIGLDLRADTVRWVTLTEADYAGASFLDARMLAPGAAGVWRPWAEAGPAAAALPRRCHFIFHISHVGSTLLSRLLGHHAALFGLREPAILRSLAEIHLGLDGPGCPWSRPEFDEPLGAYLGLWSRTFRPGQTAVIKATSFVAEMAEQLMSDVPGSRAIFLFVSPPTFLKALLGGAMSDIEQMAGRRLLRLHRRLRAPHWRFQKFSPGEGVAMSWLSEMFALHAAGTRFPGRVLWLDFDRFLETPRPALIASLTHFGADSAGEAADEILSGPTLRQYAKQPSLAFDARRRQELLHQTELGHAPEIRKGLDWLARSAELPAVRDVLEAAASLVH